MTPKYWSRVIILVASFLLLLVAIRGIQSFDDSITYLHVMYKIQGKTGIYATEAYTKAVIPLLNNPATIVLSVALGKIAGSELGGLGMLNIAGYLAAIYFYYLLATIIFKDDERAGGIPLSFIAALVLASNYSLLKFGPGAYLVDMGGWLFYIVALYCGIRFYYHRENRFAYLAGFFSMVGLFFKEYGGIGILTLIPLIFFTDLPLKKKIQLAVTSGSFMFINIGFHIFAYLERGYLYFNRYKTVVTDFAPHQNIARTIKVLGSFYLVGWPLSIWGAIRTYRDRLSQRNKALIAMIPSAIVFFAYPAYDQRICFIAVPLLALLAAIGLSKIRSRFIVVSMLLIYIVSNLSMDWIMTHFSLDAVIHLL